ncbi:MAG: hypothetical protein AB1791_14170 [Chloroflexota bacterium]
MNPRTTPYHGVKGASLLCLALAGLLLWITTGQAVMVSGASFTVNSLIDAVDANPGDGICATAAGECTLRAAVMETNALAGENTIVLPAGTYTLTIAGAGEDAAATGDLDISHNLTLVGEGNDLVAIDGNGKVTGDRVFHLLSPAEATLTGITIRGGSAPSGGGIFSDGSLTIINSNVTGNAAGRDGGGILNFNATTTMSNTTFISNTAGNYGGAIFSASGATIIRGSTFTTNSAIEGGGLANGQGAVGIVSNSFFTGNVIRFDLSRLENDFGND